MTIQTALKMGSKAITLETTLDGQVVARCPCDRLQSEVHVRLTPDEAQELLSPQRRNIAQVLPNHPPPIREIFLSGTTPAEWDATFRRKMRSAEEYRAMGYAQVPPNMLSPAPRNTEVRRTGIGIKRNGL